MQQAFYARPQILPAIIIHDDNGDDRNGGSPLKSEPHTSPLENLSHLIVRNSRGKFSQLGHIKKTLYRVDDMEVGTYVACKL